MDKKLILICSAIVILTAAFIYMSFSPNTAPSPLPINTNQETQRTATAPPPPPTTSNKRRVTAPPPPPAGLRKTVKKAVELPEGYKNYEIISRPDPIQKIKLGSTKLLKLDIKKGSEDFKIEWFKKGNGSLKKVNVGNTFSVSPEKTVVYYMATIDDKTNEPQNIFFQVEPDSNAAEATEVNANTTTTDYPETVDTTTTASPAADKEVIAEQTEPVAKLEKPVEPTPEPVTKEASKEKYTITATKETNIVAKAKTPLNIGYKIEGAPGYKISWFHRPFNRKKGALIKKRTKLNFSLKRLNKYHSGYFYIQIKDAAGKFYKSPEYKVTVK